ncbi:MAG: preprotein translocase subunit SecY [Pseudomonadota bacterium]
MNNPNLKKFSEIKTRIFFTLALLVIYRFGTYLPIPGVDPVVMEQLLNQNSEGLLGIFNMFSGGAFGRMSVFALAIMPYITASIVMQLLTVLVKPLEELKKSGDNGRKKISNYTRFLTIFITAIQGIAVALSLEAKMAVVEPGLIFQISAVTSLVGGTMFLMWLGEQITARGVGNGISIIIFAGIVAELPSALSATLLMSKTGELSSLVIIFLLCIVFGLILFIVFIEKSVRRVIIQYPKRQRGNKIYGGDKSFIPLKINTAGVIPPIFASALLLFPITLANYNFTDSSEDELSWLEVISSYLSHGSVAYILLYVVLIVFFSFFYTTIVFNPKDTADNLRKNGGFVPGYRPGASTEKYFTTILSRLTVIGSIYLSFVCIVPELLIVNYNVQFYLGGTSLLIVVNVVIDTFTQIQSHIYANKYENIINKSNLRKT